MLLSEAWLRDWVQPQINTETLAETLTMAGHEVATIAAVSMLDLSNKNRRKLVVGKIISTSKHPNADRLKLCQVDIGMRKALTIVSAAANASEALVAPVARVGALLPAGAEPAGVAVERCEIRGVISEGMLCSSAELGLSEQADGLMPLDADAPPGTLLSDYLQLNDTMLEVNLTPNRGDCLSVQGLAREVSALTATAMRDTAVKAVKPAHQQILPINMAAADACPRFVGRVIKNIDMQATTPLWMVERLRRSGLRSINLVVDITNYVMLETGQPMHAYDLDKLQGGIVVRMAKKRESIKLIDGSKITLQPSSLVIADQNKAVGLAGIMGSDNTAIAAATTNIFFEAAFFTPTYMLGKARRYGLHTDASHRFERGVNPYAQAAAIERATALLIASGGGKPGKLCQAVINKSLPPRKAIILDKNELPRILGLKIPAANVSAILNRLGMRIQKVATGWKVVAPAWRFDITAQHDLVEEIGRCYGYQKIPPRLPSVKPRAGGYPETDIALSKIKQVLTSCGYFETITYSFVDPKSQHNLLESSPGIILTNPIADNMAAMRQSLWPGLLAALVRNLNRQESSIRLFECGNVFYRHGNKRIETPKIAGLISGTVAPKQWGVAPRSVDFFDLKGDLERLLWLAPGGNFSFEATTNPALHPGQTAAIVADDNQVGVIGQLHPGKQKYLDISQKVYLFEIDQAAISVSVLPKFTAISRFPAIQRDLAVVVDQSVPVAKILDIVNVAGGEYLKKLELFDIYNGDKVENNKKSFAFSLTFQSDSSNLRSSEMERVTDKIIAALQTNSGAELRN